MRVISCVAAPCSSIAEAMVVEISLTSTIVKEIRLIAATASAVSAWIVSIWARMSSVACDVCVASDLTSDATTAKPRPASPARAASMVALRASRLVWLAIWVMKATTSPIFCAASARPVMLVLVFSLSSLALRATTDACVT